MYMMYRPFDTFVFRTPLFPINKLNDILSNETLFGDLIKDLIFHEAIFLASPVLYKETLKYLNNNLNDKDAKRLLNSLTKYIERMFVRCTPFGIFAACGVGQVCNNANNSNIVITSQIDKKTKLDMFYLYKLAEAISRSSSLRHLLKYHVNNSLYRVGRDYRYTEYEYVNGVRKYKISSVNYSEYLDKIISTSRQDRSVDLLIESLIDEEISREDALEFIDELIDNQIIISQLEPLLPEDDILRRLLEIYNSEKISNGESVIFSEIKRDLEELNCTSVKSNYSRLNSYNQIIQKINKIGIQYNENYLFQVDSYRHSINAELGQKVVQELMSVMRILNKTCKFESNQEIKDFIQAFSGRYEEEEIPLCIALDPEIGLGYPINQNTFDSSLILKDFFLPQKNNDIYTEKNTLFHDILFEKVLTALKNNEKEITLIDDDFKDFNENWEDLPTTMSCIFEILDNSEDRFLLKIVGFAGSSAANVLSRFAHMNCDILNLTNNIINQEKKSSPDVILAEIIHLPDLRTGNIISHPNLRDYSIEYLATSDIDNDRLMSISDLMISVRHGRLYLRSKINNVEVIPRLTNAHNYSYKSVPIYRFLCDIQLQQKRQGLIFSWGNLENKLEFKPRVKYRNSILSPASWILDKKEIDELVSYREREDLISKINLWQEHRDIPQLVLLSEGDNKLYTNLHNIKSINAFLSSIKNQERVQITEYIYNDDSSLISDLDGNIYHNECILPFYKQDSYGKE